MAGAGQRLSWNPQEHQVPAMGLNGIQSRRWASQELLPRRTMSWNLPETSIRTNPRPMNAPSWSSKRLRRQTSFNRYHSPLRDSQVDSQDPWQPSVCSWVSEEAHPRSSAPGGSSAGTAGYKAKEGSRLQWDFNHHWDALRSSPLVLNVTAQSEMKVLYKSILKGQTTTRKKIAKVYFPAEESEVIGEGGEDAGTLSDHDSDDEAGNACPEDEVIDKEEDEAIQALQELTRFNTDFNSVAANLMKDSAPSPSTSTPSRNFTPLKLGKPLTDAEGKRQTLLVTVQPFGDKSPSIKITPNEVTSPKSSGSNGISLSTSTPTIQSNGTSTQAVPDTQVQVGPSASPKQMFLKSIVEPEEPATIVIKPLLCTNTSTTTSPPMSPPTSTPSSTPTIQTSDVSQTKQNQNNSLSGRPEKRTHITRATPITKNNEVLLKTKLILTSKNDEMVKSKAFQRDSKNISADLKTMPALLPSLKAENDVVIVSRASVGEPDGRADPDEPGERPPPILSSPPKKDSCPTSEAMTLADPRPSFLHGLSKPKLPVKPQSVPQRWATPVLTTPVGIAAAAAANAAAASAAANTAARSDGPHTPTSSPPPSPPPTPPMTSSDSGEASGRALKRQAPKPPASADDSITASVCDEFDQEENDGGNDEVECLPPEKVNCSEPTPPSCSALRTRDISNGLSPTSRSESVPALVPAVVQVQIEAPQSPSSASASTPLPQPRKALSKSHDSLASPPFAKYLSSSGAYEAERKKNGTKGRFSLRKLLGLARESARDESISPGGLAEFNATFMGVRSPSDLSSQPPQLRPRPRLEIIHPSDLNGTAVEVVRGTGPEVRRQIREATEALHAAQAAQVAQAAYRRGSDVSSDSSGSQPPIVGSPPHAAGRPMKPPPPPRSASTESECAHETAGIGRPSRPPPPKSAELLRRQRQPPSPPVAPSLLPSSTTTSSDSTESSVYANLDLVSGEVRNGLAPHKPQRTGSVRDASAEGPKRTPLAASLLTESANDATKGAGALSQQDASKRASRQSKDSVRTSLTRMTNLPAAVQPDDSGYESVELASEQAQSGGDSENVYECVNGNSSPECDLATVGASAGTERSTNSSDFPRFSTFLRPSSVSIPYCGSETESDIYSPYSFYGSEEGGEDDTDAASAAWKYGRRQLRKGRSIVHKSMEENYGAVVGANHEALAQLLEQVKAGPPVPLPLRPLKTQSSLSWSDFTVNARTCVSVGQWTFLSAHWGTQPVTLGVVPHQGPPTALNTRLGAFALVPITEFSDLVPVVFLPASKSNNKDLVPAWIGVISRVRVDTLSSYGQFLSRMADGTPTPDNEAVANGSVTDDKAIAAREEALREASVVLLQLVNALKGLQAQGEEEASPDSVVLLRDPATDHSPQLALLHSLRHSEQNGMSVCQCALYAVHCLLPAGPLITLVSSLLSKERAESLSRAKAVLEYWLWGPGDATLGMMIREREAALQRWLDLERATVLHRLVCARTAGGASHRLAPPEQSQLMFLVRTSAKTMCEAAQLLDSQSIKPLDNSSF